MKRLAQTAACLAMLAASTAGTSREKPRWILAATAPPDSPTVVQAGEPALRRIERAAGVRIVRRWGGTLGDEASTLEATRKGRIHLWIGSAGALSEAIPALAVLDVPYLFADLRELHARTPRARFEEGALAAAWQQAGLAPAAGPFSAGWRSISARRAVRTAEDLRGLRVRAQASSPIQLGLWRALGAKPVPTELREVSLALRADAIDALDLPLIWLFATSAASEIKHYTDTRHILQTAFIVFHRPALEGLPPAARAEVQRICDEAAVATSQVGAKVDVDLTALLARHATIQPLSARERDAWRSAMAPAAEQASALGPAATALLARLRAP